MGLPRFPHYSFALSAGKNLDPCSCSGSSSNAQKVSGPPESLEYEGPSWVPSCTGGCSSGFLWAPHSAVLRGRLLCSSWRIETPSLGRSCICPLGLGAAFWWCFGFRDAPCLGYSFLVFWLTLDDTPVCVQKSLLAWDTIWDARD